MANTIAHLAVANKMLKAKKGLIENKNSFFLGAVAPDAIESMDGAVRDDKKRVHLRLGISDMEWLQPEKMSIFDERLDAFVDEHIRKALPGKQRDFCVGYAVHLLTDKYNHSSLRQKVLKKLIPQGFEDGTWNFIYEVLNELEALDFYLLNAYPEISGIFYELIDAEPENCLPGYIEKEYLEKSFRWWKEEYIPQISGRRLKILEEDDIEYFVRWSSEEILKDLEKLL